MALRIYTVFNFFFLHIQYIRTYSSNSLAHFSHTALDPPIRIARPHPSFHPILGRGTITSPTATATCLGAILYG